MGDGDEFRLPITVSYLLLVGPLRSAIIPRHFSTRLAGSVNSNRDIRNCSSVIKVGVTLNRNKRIS